jgi:hypothetical protein
MIKLKWYNNDTSLYNKQLEIEAASRIKGAYTYTGQLKLHEIPTSLRLVKYTVSAGKLKYCVGVNSEILPNVLFKETYFVVSKEQTPEDFYTIDIPRNFHITDEKEAELLGVPTYIDWDIDFTKEIPDEKLIIRFCLNDKYKIETEQQIGASIYKISTYNITALQVVLYDLTGLMYPREVLEPYVLRASGVPELIRDVIVQMPELPKAKPFIEETSQRDID